MELHVDHFDTITALFLEANRRFDQFRDLFEFGFVARRIVARVVFAIQGVTPIDQNRGRDQVDGSRFMDPGLYRLGNFEIDGFLGALRCILGFHGGPMTEPRVR